MDAAHAHSARVVRSHWFLLVQFVPRVLFPGQRPAHEASFLGEGKGSTEEPISATMAGSCRLFDSGDGLQEFKGACEVRPVDLLENSSFQLLDRLFQKAHVLETVFDQEAVCITQAMTSQGFDELGIFRFARPRAKCAISSELAFPSNRASRIACPVTRGRFRSSRSLPPEPFAGDSAVPAFSNCLRRRVSSRSSRISRGGIKLGRIMACRSRCASQALSLGVQHSIG